MAVHIVPTHLQLISGLWTTMRYLYNCTTFIIPASTSSCAWTYYKLDWINTCLSNVFVGHDVRSNATHYLFVYCSDGSVERGVVIVNLKPMLSKKMLFWKRGMMLSVICLSEEQKEDLISFVSSGAFYQYMNADECSIQYDTIKNIWGAIIRSKRYRDAISTEWR
jgi:hypothetical protein